MRTLPRLRTAAAVIALIAGSLALALVGQWGRAGASSGGATVVVQTMDSCKQILGGASYSLTGGGVSMDVSTPSGHGSVSGGSCPVEQGSCSAGPCVSFTGVPDGTYRIVTTRTPPPNSSNPEGYAPCEGGSACRSQEADVTVSGGRVSGTVTNVYPNGKTTQYSFSGTSGDPILFHDFGLAAPGSATNAQCDGDSDADDHLTGSPSGACAYPENQESSACKPFPWSCTLGNAVSAPTPGKHGKSSGGPVTGSAGGTAAVPDGNVGFVMNLYHDILGRLGDTSEVGYWATEIAGGRPRQDVAAFFSTSPEVYGRDVDAAYQKLIGRAADADGRAYWVSQLEAGGYDEALLTALAATPTYDAGHGGGSDSGFVTALYRDILGRTPSDDELNGWLARGPITDRAGIAHAFAFSHEHHLDVVAASTGGWYERYLNREADPAGAQYWATQLDHGTRDEVGVAAFTSSDEYYAKPVAH